METLNNVEQRFVSILAQTLGCLNLTTLPPTRRAVHSWCRVVAPYFSEFFGALIVTLTVSLTSRTDSGYEAQNVFAPLAIGAMVTSMIYAYGHNSGAHFNPAVTIAIFIRGKISLRVLIPYFCFQVAGALAGAKIAASIVGPDFIPLTSWKETTSTGNAFLMEFLFTYALCATVLNTTTTASLNGNQFYGIAVGFVITAGATAIGPITGAALNPAFATAFSVVHQNTTDLWLYWIAGLSAGVSAGIMFHITNNEEADLRFLAPEVDDDDDDNKGGTKATIEERATSVGGHTNTYRRKLSTPWLKKESSNETTSTTPTPTTTIPEDHGEVEA